MLASMTRFECFGLIGIALLFDLFSRTSKRQKLTAVGIAFAAAVPMILWMVGMKPTAADPNTRTFRATFTMEKPNRVGVLSGMTAKLVLTGLLTTAPDDFLVPAQAVVADSHNEPFVWLVDPETMQVRRTVVSIGEMSGSDVTVISGLKTGDLVATSGVHHLADGMEVRRFED